MDSTQESYVKPTVEDLGDLVALTAAQQNGDALDRDFPRGTPKSSLTFS
jgi:hypothetical protein